MSDTILVSMDNPPSMEELGAVDGITNVDQLNDRRIRLRFNASPDITKKIITMSVQKGWELKEIMLEKGSLDEVFAQLSNKK
jgi:ABC-2 type transport system ATP-binding protein